ncbi:probable Rho GTPase-activating protein CG5521 [Cydia pomonella]|uniref:probable Rho GTPase-activating protein CG5521 n=1 Tax=Cydia pomonella TaxID=82600 RepID=UPI002ADE0B7C|nr:probable Rho GTPase-activating protein CG5521 [Cydia pomonella]
MFTKKSHQDVKKSTVKIQDSKKDSATRLKHLKIVLEHIDADEAKTYFEANFSHVYFILYDNFIQAENNLRQRELPFHLVHKAGREELEGALSLLEKVLCLLPELIGKRWQLHSLTRIFSKLLHSGNSQKLRAESIRYFLLWYQALGDNAPVEVHKMFASLVPGLPEPCILPSGSPLKGKPDPNAPNDSGDFSMEDILHHPNFSSTTDNAKKVVVEQTTTGFMGKLANVSASIFHDTNALNPVQCVEVQPLLPPSANEKAIDNETKHFFEILLEGMASSVTKIHWKDRSHAKCMRSFAFLLERFKMYYLPVICPQYNSKNSLYKPNLELPVQHNILDDDYVLCRVILIKWVANYAHFLKKTGSDGGQPSSMTSTGSHVPHSNTPTPAASLHHEEETSFTVGQPSDSSRASSHDSASNTPHPSLEPGCPAEELCSSAVVRDVLCGWSREHVDFTVEVLRQAFLLPFAHAGAARRVIALYKDWIQMNVSEIPPFLLENTYEPNEPAAPPRRLRNDSYLGAVGRDNVMVRAGLQNVLQVFMTQAANVFLASSSPVAPPGGLGQQQLLEEQTDTCKRVLNIYRYMVMHVAMDAGSWEQLLLVLLQITSLVLTKVPPKRKQESLGGFLAPALFQTLIVTWIKANLNVAVKQELWQNFMELLTRLTHWEELITEWAKTMETLTRVLARHVYSLDLSESSEPRGRGRDGRDGREGRGERRATPAPAPHRQAPPPQQPEGRSLGKSPKLSAGATRRAEAGARRLTRARSDPHLHKHAPTHTHTAEETKEPTSNNKPRRWYSLDSLRHSSQHEERDSASESRSPSPAPSSGVESSSMKDSPLQIDLASDGGNVEWSENETTDSLAGSAGVGVVMGGGARGWLPDVAAVMWRRMLAALGDPNLLRDPQAHKNLYKYLIHLNTTLLKISQNQTLNGNTEIHVPFNLVAGWCLEAEALPPSHRAGKLLALRLLCESTQAQAQGPGAPSSCNNRLHLAHLHLYQRALHHGLTGEDRSVVDVLVEYAAPRYLSLALDGYSLLLLDFVHASTVVLNSSDMGPTCPRTAAVTFLGSLLALPDSLMNAPMLQPYPHQYNTVSCPDLKEHVLNIVVRVCRREGAAAARCCGACALTAHVCRLLAARQRCPRLPAIVTCLLQMLMMKNKHIAKVVSDCILVLADYTDRIVEMYPGLAGKIIKWICACLAQLASSSGRDSVKPLAGSLLLCLAEFAVRCGPTYLMQEKEGDQTLLLIIFKVLYAVMRGANTDIEGLSLPVDEDFDPNIQPGQDNLGQKTAPASTIDVKLWAQTICTQLVLFLGHWPLWSSCQLSCGVGEQHDSSPPLGPELGAAVLSAPHIQLLRLSDATLASLVELPALPPPPPAPGLATSDRQVRVLLRDIAGKACWDASALYYDPTYSAEQEPEPLPLPESVESPRDNTLSSLPPPLPPDLLPDYQNCPPDKHQLDHVLAYIGHTSPEVVDGRRLDEAGPSPLPPGAEDELVAALVAHRNAERHYLASRDSDEELEIPERTDSGSAGPFSQCRLLLAQLGTLAPSRRAHAQLLRRSERLLRELRNLDAQRCRETHKVAVIYVGKGQETRNEILSNRCGSPAYEAFLAALAWEVELESHVGFTGGLRGGGGATAPYVATLTLEALFHVATRMPADTPDAILNKTRHLGNDEVHVVWSEHWRAYKRDTLPTQFCDVLIVLYPLSAGLLRVTVSRKPSVAVFGPLWEEGLVSVECGAALVRGAAAAGGRAVRATMPLYQHAYSERARSLQQLVQHHTQPATFEHFVERVRDPVPAVTQPQEQNTGRLAAALLDAGAAAWGGGGGGGGDALTVSPRAGKRLGPFRRPPHPPPAEPAPAPAAAPAPASASASAPAPAPRKHR